MGRTDSGGFTTAPLKEFPPALNRAIAQAASDSVQRADHCPGSDPDEVGRWHAMVQFEMGLPMGADYAPAAQPRSDVQHLRAEAAPFVGQAGR